MCLFVSKQARVFRHGRNWMLRCVRTYTHLGASTSPRPSIPPSSSESVPLSARSRLSAGTPITHALISSSDAPNMWIRRCVTNRRWHSIPEALKAPPTSVIPPAPPGGSPNDVASQSAARRACVEAGMSSPYPTATSAMTTSSPCVRRVYTVTVSIVAVLSMPFSDVLSSNGVPPCLPWTAAAFQGPCQSDGRRTGRIITWQIGGYPTMWNHHHPLLWRMGDQQQDVGEGEGQVMRASGGELGRRRVDREPTFGEHDGTGLGLDVLLLREEEDIWGCVWRGRRCRVKTTSLQKPCSVTKNLIPPSSSFSSSSSPSSSPSPSSSLSTIPSFLFHPHEAFPPSARFISQKPRILPSYLSLSSGRLLLPLLATSAWWIKSALHSAG